MVLLTWMTMAVLKIEASSEDEQLGEGVYRGSTQHAIFRNEHNIHSKANYCSNAHDQ